jgi:hypothetical protein
MDYPFWGPATGAGLMMVLAGLLHHSERELSYILTAGSAALAWLVFGPAFVDRSTVVSTTVIVYLAVGLWSTSWAFRYRRRESR